MSTMTIYVKTFSNNDPVLIFDLFTAKVICFLMHLYGDNVENLQYIIKVAKGFTHKKSNFYPQRLSASAMGYIRV